MWSGTSVFSFSWGKANKHKLNLKKSWTYGLSCGPEWLQPPNKQLKVCFPPASAGACCCISSQQANLSPTSFVWCKLNFFTNNFYSVLCPRVSFCYLPYLTLRLAIMISCHMNVVINLISQPRGQCSYECGHMKGVESDQSHTMTGLQGAKRMILHRKIKLFLFYQYYIIIRVIKTLVNWYCINVKDQIRDVTFILHWGSHTPHFELKWTGQVKLPFLSV